MFGSCAPTVRMNQTHVCVCNVLNNVEVKYLNKEECKVFKKNAVKEIIHIYSFKAAVLFNLHTKVIRCIYINKRETVAVFKQICCNVCETQWTLDQA